MATMKITEYKDIASAGGALQAPQEPPLSVTPVTSSGTTAQSAALNAETKLVSVQLGANGYIQFGTNPVATSSTSRLHEANAVSFHGVPVGGTYKIAVIDA